MITSLQEKNINKIYHGRNNQPETLCKYAGKDHCRCPKQTVDKHHQIVGFYPYRCICGQVVLMHRRGRLNEPYYQKNYRGAYTDENHYSQYGKRPVFQRPGCPFPVACRMSFQKNTSLFVHTRKCKKTFRRPKHIISEYFYVCKQIVCRFSLF